VRARSRSRFETTSSIINHHLERERAKARAERNAKKGGRILCAFCRTTTGDSVPSLIPGRRAMNVRKRHKREMRDERCVRPVLWSPPVCVSVLWSTFHFRCSHFFRFFLKKEGRRRRKKNKEKNFVFFSRFALFHHSFAFCVLHQNKAARV
jgi:hypothetical protein